MIRVNPTSIRAYATDAQGRFESIRGELEALTRDVVTVRYTGPNASAFAAQCGELATAFSQALLRDLGGIAEAIRASTSNISAALGGAPVVIDVNGSPVVAPPVPPGDGSVDVDTSALEALRPVVAARFGALQESLQAHIARLGGTDWEGQAKRQAVEAVTGFTAAARARAQDAEASIIGTIDRQVTAVLAADR